MEFDELVLWLKAKPDDVDINAHHSAILDKGAKSGKPIIVICRIGGIEFKDDKIYMLRKEVIDATNHLIGAPSDAWVEQTDDGSRNAKIEYDDAVA